MSVRLIEGDYTRLREPMMEIETRKHSEILRDAQRVIADPKNFFMGDYAMARDGKTVHPTSPLAARWCSRGVIAHVSGVPISAHDAGVTAHPLYRYLDRAAAGLYGEKTYRVNDIEGHAGVVNMFEEAIRLAESDEATA